MTLSKRERQISVVVLAAAVLFLFDQLALSPYLAERARLQDDAVAKADELTAVRKVMREEGKLRGVLVRMGAAMGDAAGGDGGRQADASWAEGRILAALQEWERSAGVGKASFNRVRSTEQYGFTRLTFQVSATGKMPAIAGLIYRAETATIPLRIDQMQVVLSGDSGEDLQVQMTISTLCRTGGAGGGGKPEAVPRRGGGVASADPIGGRR
jgi:hypothetical protein